MQSGCAPILTSFISITTSSACSRCDENELRTTYAGMLGACEQANLVANEAKLIEPANAIIAFNCHLTHGHAGHAPDGQITHLAVQPLREKYSASPPTQITSISAPSRPT